MIAARRRARRPWQRKDKGFMLIALLALLAMGGLYFLISNLTPEAIEARRRAKTEAALVEAKDALMGYALRYRERLAAQDANFTGDDDSAMYGFFPMPDMGKLQNKNEDLSNPPCVGEGCATLNQNQISTTHTYIGRFPWKTLGTKPIRDGYEECLWYVVSASHREPRQDLTAPMNWDTLSHLDAMKANGSSLLASVIESPHDRPVVVIFSPGPPLKNQNRSPSTSDDVTECGGNYVASNYLDPGPLTPQPPAPDLNGVSNYHAAATNAGSLPTSSDNQKQLSLQGPITRRSDDTLWVGECPPKPGEETGCAVAANDKGLSISADQLFGTVRKRPAFVGEINGLLDHLEFCLRPRGFPSPQNTADFAQPPNTWTFGRLPDSVQDCTAVPANPLGYFFNFSDNIFYAKCNDSTDCLSATIDGSTTNCTAVIVFSNQRAIGKKRSTDPEKKMLSNYLEGENLTTVSSFPSPPSFVGDKTLKYKNQPAEQDVIRCIPFAESDETNEVTSQPLADAGFGQLVAYDAATRTLTLGQENVTTGLGAPGAALFGCAWQTNSHALDNGFRSYFQFQFKRLGTSVGTNGFVFAIADAINNSLASCGAAGSHLGYSGDNGSTPKITFPKIGIEFDQGRNWVLPNGFSEAILNPGRIDPCGTTALGCAGLGFNSHAAIIYWGHEYVNAVDAVNLPNNDDNVHGFPSATSQAGSTRPAPTNPAYPSSGIEFKDMRGKTTLNGDSYVFHVRVEITPYRSINPSTAELSSTSIQTEVWIESDANSVNQIVALKNTTRPLSQLYPGYASTLKDSALIYDVPVESSSCPCPATQACGSDNVCYRPALQTLRLGFTGSQRTSDQEVNITDFFTTWLP
ncbi:MAG: hypothetical protein NDI67_00690 [Sulfuritalea sp.]|nr:hypothetical protein [Sulfuritalea sp.]